MPAKRWTIKKHDREAVKKLAGELNVQPLIAALLISRGHETPEKAHRFLNPSPEHLHEPFLLKGMQEAVDRIQKAVADGEKILIWGDYDVDGTTGTVLLRKALRILGAETGFHVPNRFTEGYGINIPALEEAQNDGFSLVISVDCGTTNVKEVEFANSIGLDIIITDHHLPKIGEPLPSAVAVVNYNQPGCPYPDKHLAGVGVAFKLAHALLREKGLEHEVLGFLKIAALGTVADMMNLTGENRAIVALGLIDLPRTENYGLKALMEVADCRSDMTSYHIGFRIGPRINAAGRMDVAQTVVELFEADDFSKARQLAGILDSRNRERQLVQQQTSEIALQEAIKFDEPYFIVVSGAGWHEGVIGLAASRIVGKLNRPTLVIAIDGEIGKGSARSIENYDIYAALDTCKDLLPKFGGHPMAAGLSINKEDIDELRKRLNEHAKTHIPPDDLIPKLRIDAALTAETLGLDLVESLAAFEPFGKGNPKPIFVTRNLIIRDEPFVMKDKHLKLKLSGDGGKHFEAVWWDGVERSKGQTLKPNSRIELAYVPEANLWQGNTRLQLVVEDLRADN